MWTGCVLLLPVLLTELLALGGGEGRVGRKGEPKVLGDGHVLCLGPDAGHAGSTFVKIHQTAHLTSVCFYHI